MGIDHGTARIGVAISDEIGLLAHPLETVAAADPERALLRLAELVASRQIEDLVVGIPLRWDGSEGSAAARVREFLAQLQARLPDTLRYHEIDESFTTLSAQEKLRAAGRNAKNSKGIIDQAAAVEILQTWLDARAAGTDLLAFDGDDLPD